MGNAPSVENLKGFQILNVLPSSPANDAKLIPYFDFIIKINNQFITKENATQLLQLISQQQPLTILVYNSRNLSIVRKIISPRIWKEEKDGLLGCNIRLASFDKAHMLIWHVLEVVKNSPAEHAKLQPNTYILGSPDGHYDEEYGFYQHVKDCADSTKPCQIYVFDPKSNDTRLVNVQANYEWGGQGCLGADVGYGLLHRLVEEDPNFDDLLQQNEENQSLLQEEEPLSNLSNLSINQEASIVSSENKIHDPTEHFTKAIQQKQTIPQQQEESVEVQLFAKELDTQNHKNHHEHNHHEHDHHELEHHDRPLKSPQSVLPKTITTPKKTPEQIPQQVPPQAQQSPVQPLQKIASLPSKLASQPPTIVAAKSMEIPQPVRQQSKPAVHPRVIATSNQPTAAPRQEAPKSEAQVDEWSNVGQASNGEQTADTLFGNDLSKPLEDELSELLSGDLR